MASDAEQDTPRGISPEDTPGPTSQLCSWLASLKLEHVPKQVRERAKSLILDGLACALIGAQLPWSRTAVESVLAFEGSGSASILGWGRVTSVPAAALLNGTFIQGFELDDFYLRAPLHSNSLILPALLAACQAPDVGPVTGADFLKAVIAGYEVGPRVGQALHGWEMLSRGWHSGAVFGTHPAAAAVGCLLGLTDAQFEDALGLAGTQSAGLMAAQYGAMCKRMHHGMASRNGLYAAFLARGGYTGIKKVFEQPYGGYLSVFGEGHNPDISQVTSALGQLWETESIIVKPYAVMGGLHAALDGFFEIVKGYPFRADDIEAIDVELSHAVYHHGWWPLERPLTPVGAQMNICYALAVAAIDGKVLASQFSPSRIDSDDVWAFIPRINVRHNPDFDGGKSQSRTILRIRFKDGTIKEVDKEAARSALSPLPRDEVVAKYRSLTEDIMDQERRERLEQLILSLEDIPDMRAVMDILAPMVGSTFESR